jgi:prepilin-type processing-associated H-X9-DG protein
MRYLALIVVAFAFIALFAGGALAADRPLASLVPADASAYSELNLDRMLGRAPGNAELGRAFAQMKSPQLIAQTWSELAKDEPDMTKAGDLLGMIGDALDALGPRVGWAMWSTDLQSLMGAMMGAKGGDDSQAMMKMMPKVLLLADVRDAATLDAAISQLASEAKLELRTSESGGMKTISFANGMVELIRGSDWLALSFPPEPARKAADRAASAAADSLLATADYQRAMQRVPADAAYTEYVSPAYLKQFIALVGLISPAAGVSYPADEPFVGATGVRVEEVGGRKMATVYYTADLDLLVNTTDGTLSLLVAILKPVIQQQKEQARRQALSDTCGSQLEQLAAAMDSYLADHDNRYPSADRWVQELRPYIEDAKVFKCPEDTSEAFSSYGMNAALSGLSPDDVADPEWTVLFYETASPGANPSGGADDVADSPRHVDGNNFAFVDGSISAFSPDDEEQPVWNPEESTAEDA